MTQNAPLRGYTALISVLVMSFMLTTLAVLAGENGLRTVLNTIDLTDHRAAVHAARSCADIALLTIAQDGSYEGRGEVVRLSEDLFCVIEEAREKRGEFLIRARTLVGRSVSRIEVEGFLSATSTPVVTRRREF